MEAQEQPLFERVDGEAFFARLVDRFYAGVVADPVLAPLYPPDDIEGAKARLTGFLVQFWGGPDDYSRARGHPRLRMRHAPFVIGEAQREAWFRHMATAVGQAAEVGEVDAEDEARMLSYFHRAALHMVNQVGGVEGAPGPPGGT